MPTAEAGFIGRLRARAAERGARIAFAEADEPRVHTAIAEALDERLFTPVLVGDPRVAAEGLAAAGVAADRVTLVDAADPGLVERCEALLADRRRRRGAGISGVARHARDPLHQAGVLLAEGEVDGAVAGAVRTTADVVRAALGAVGLVEGVATLSSAFFMVVGTGSEERVLTFADAGVVPAPSAPQLAGIAASAAAAHAAVVGETPRVAFLSYSTKGSAEGASVSLAREALALFTEAVPGVDADGELQADAALDAAVAARKAPGSTVAGRANVLVFPDLAAANIAYKLVHGLAGARALGPVLQGLARPFNDLSRGASPGDVVDVACVGSLMAVGREDRT